ncbi:30S ribosomal protein S6 [Patescibacteria group bacterium]|nr:30S ribosomal protein S6 [Patescibacteria group bacterium]MBU0963598.1 30S ribosomal protein S6 [Patescibacteria group bacterium]
MLQNYELLFIISLKKAGEKSHEALVKKIQKVITDSGGSMVTLEDWGRRRLAYEINGEKFCNYILMEFEIENEHIKKITSAIKLMPEIIRHSLVQKRIKSEKELAKEQRIKEKIAAKEEQEQEKEKEVAKPAVVEKKTEPEKPKPTEPKISLEDLDKKLDDILKEEI